MTNAVSRLLRIAGVIAGLWAAPALACEEYVTHDASTLKSLRDKLVEPGADSIDRLFAFQELVCSSNPTMRAYAVREGLRTSSDQLVREQIMLDALMQKDRIEIEMTAGPSATPDDKEFIKSLAGVWVGNVGFRSVERGCLSLYSNKECSSDAKVVISGDKVQFTYQRIVGEFVLTDTNELVGYLRAQAHQRFTRIPAILKLN